MNTELFMAFYWIGIGGLVVIWILGICHQIRNPRDYY